MRELEGPWWYQEMEASRGCWGREEAKGTARTGSVVLGRDHRTQTEVSPLPGSRLVEAFLVVVLFFCKFAEFPPRPLLPPTSIQMGHSKPSLYQLHGPALSDNPPKAKCPKHGLGLEQIRTLA